MPRFGRLNLAYHKTIPFVVGSTSKGGVGKFRQTGGGPPSRWGVGGEVGSDLVGGGCGFDQATSWGGGQRHWVGVTGTSKNNASRATESRLVGQQRHKGPRHPRHRSQGGGDGKRQRAAEGRAKGGSESGRATALLVFGSLGVHLPLLCVLVLRLFVVLLFLLLRRREHCLESFNKY